MLSSLRSSPVSPQQKMRASRFDNRLDNMAKIISITWQQVCLLFAEHERRNEKDGQLISPARYEPGINTFKKKDKESGKDIYFTAQAGNGEIQRIDENVRGISYALLDIEGKPSPLTTADIESLIGRARDSGLAFAIATTHSHTPDDSRARMVLAPDREITTDELWPVLKGLGAAFGVPIDRLCRNPSRMFYTPAAIPGAPVISAIGGDLAFSVEAAKALGEQLIAAEDAARPPRRPIVERRVERSEAVRRATAYANATPPAIEGAGGDAHTYTLCVTIARGFDLADDDALESLRPWNDRCEPPWSEEELLKKISNARVYGREPIGGRLLEAIEDASVPDGFNDFDFRGSQTGPDADGGEGEDKAAPGVDPIYAKALGDLHAHKHMATARGNQLVFTDWSTLRTKTFPKTPWMIEGLMPERSVGAAAGEPKATKTWSALEMAVALATGTPAFGQFDVTKRTGVACFMVEDQERSIHGRCRALIANRGLPEDSADGWLHVISRAAINVGNDDEVAGLIAAVRRIPRPVGMLVIDPLRDIHQADENDSGEMSRVMGQLRAIRDILGCSVLFVHHASKSSDATSSRRAGQMMRGSSAIHGALDVGIYLSKTHTDGEAHWDNEVMVEIKAARGAGKFKLDLDVEDDETDQAILAKWTVDYGDDKKESAEQAILAALDANSPQSCGALSKKTGKRKAETIGALKALDRAGKAHQVFHKTKSMGWVLSDISGCVPEKRSVPEGRNSSPDMIGSEMGSPIYRGTHLREPMSQAQNEPKTAKRSGTHRPPPEGPKDRLTDEERKRLRSELEAIAAESEKR